MNIILFILAVASLLILLWQVSNIISILFGSPYVHSDHRVIIESLKLACLKKREIFYELGCGNGEVLIEAAKYGAKAVGFEISPYYYIWAKIRTLRNPNITVRYQNIKNVDLSRAEVVYCYLLPNFLEKLKAKFQRELKPGSRLISVGFPIKIEKGQKYKINNHKIYIYTFQEIFQHSAEY